MEIITIRINPRTKAGKAFKAVLEAVYSKLPGIEVVQEEKIPAKTQKLLDEFRASIPEVIKQGKSKKKGKSLQSLIDEL